MFVWFIWARPVERRVNLCLFGSFGGVPGVDGFIPRAPRIIGFINVRIWARPGCRPVHSVLFRFIPASPGCRRFHSGSLGSFGRSPAVVGFIQGRLVHLGAPQWSSGSLGFVWFIRAVPGVRRVHSGSFGTFWRAPGVPRFILVRLLHSPGVSGVIRVRLVHSGAPRVWSGLFWFISLHPGGRRVHSVHSGAPLAWSCSFQRVVGFIRVRLVHSGAYRRQLWPRAKKSSPIRRSVSSLASGALLFWPPLLACPHRHQVIAASSEDLPCMAVDSAQTCDVDAAQVQGRHIVPV